ncbi:MAG: hypothetical protein U9R34_08530 [Nanoarchaeota archaeon]|nr:hypothetical protein [Nanoarchaeota archaeon]
MKKVTLFLILALISFTVSETYADDFRKTKWGMSQNEVLASETLKPSEQTPEMIIYQNRVINKKVLIGYRFIQDKLYSAGYVLQEEHSHSHHFILDYKDFKNALTSKYGKPESDKEIWRSEYYKKTDALHKGWAISVGNLSYLSQWKTENTEICLILHGDNMKVNCGMTYISEKFKYLKEQKDIQQNRADF